jgi:hypothetical protein
MKKLILLFNALFVVALAVVCAMLLQQQAALKASLVAAQAELESVQAELADAEANLADTEQQRDYLRGELLRLATQPQLPTGPGSLAAAATTNAPSTNAPAKGGLGEMMSKFLDDPAMKKMVADQQRAMLDTMYGPLFKQLNLTPEQETAFKDLLAKQQAQAMELAGDLMSGDKAKREAAMKEITAQNQQTDDAIRNLLGESGYASYKDYQDTMSDRMAMQQFNQSLAGAGGALSDAQSQALLQILTEERRGTPWGAGDNPFSSNPGEAGLQAALSAEAANQFFEHQQQVNQRVLDRAATTLNAEQLEALRKHQENQLRMQKWAMEMGRRFMGGGENP